MRAEPRPVSPAAGPPADLAAELARRGIGLTGPMGAGASCTQLYHATSRTGEHLVVKVLRQGEDPVDGHDLATFRSKRLQIEHLRACAPELSPYYVPITEEVSGADSVGHVMPYVEGDDLLATARAGPHGADGSAQLIAGVLAQLSVSGYANQRRPPHDDASILAHAERIRRRLRFLAPPLIPAAAITSPGCHVNGVACQPLLPLLEAVTTSPRLRAILRPQLVSLPVHGDLNTRNVLVRKETGAREFALIDPRGTLQPVDIGYDLGKIVLSVTLWDPLLRIPASVLPDGPGDGDVRVAVPLYAGYDALLSRLPAVLGGTQPLADLLARTGAWRARVAFIHAVHAIAEAACRVSDARARGLPASDRRVLAAARAFFFTGLLLLNDVRSRLQAADDIDLDEHWHVLRRVHRLVPALSEGS